MTRGLVVFLLLILSVNLALAKQLPTNEQLIKNYKSLNLDNYKPKHIYKKIKKKLYGDGVDLISIEKISMMPKKNIYVFKDIWQKAGILWPDVVVLSNGVYDLDRIYSLIGNEKVIKKSGKNSYILKRPLYISPTATLVVKNTTLKLSIKHGVSITYHGNLDVVAATITSWDIKNNNYGARKNMKYSDILILEKQQLRPYILGLEGSYINIIDSNIVGLGFKGSPGTYGISLVKRYTNPLVVDELASLVKNRARPSGKIIGSNISKCFFGFYSNKAEDIFLLGNLFYENIVYAIDPHDYTKKLVAARNITYKSKFSHGIIFSREVDNSFIAENISFLNKSSGIMLDRKCQHTLIYKNICFYNKNDGISVVESDKNSIVENYIMLNKHNGIFIRNSSGVNVYKNYIYHNAFNGAEITVVDISADKTRDFKRDPYHKKTEVSFIENYFEKNINSVLASKNEAKLFFHQNSMENSGPNYFLGDIEKHTSKIFTANKKNGYLFNTKEVKIK